MSEQNTPPPGGKPQQINLQQIAQQFMLGLQRHYDLLAFNLACREKADEAGYNAKLAMTKVMPVPQAHQNFEQMQAIARDLMFRQVIGDSLNLCATCLNQSHLFLALIKANKENAGDQAAAQQAAQASQQKFAQMPFDQKFEYLEKEYEVICSLEDTIVSLGFLMQAMMQHQGEVQAAQAEEDGTLTLELKAVQLTPGEEGQNPTPEWKDVQKVFKVGEKVDFTDEDLLLVIVTLGSFADGLFKSVARFAQDNQPPQ